jgi:hypothetical protein
MRAAPPVREASARSLYVLEKVGRQLGEFAPLALRENDVRSELLTAEALGGDRQAIRSAVDVRVVDLARVAREDDLRAVAGAGDDRLDLVGRQILRLVERR